MPRLSAALKPFQKKALYASTALLWLSGAVWMYFDFLKHIPAIPLWMKLHGAAAMIFLMVFGSLLLQHVPAGWSQKKKRSSGVPLLAICGLLVVSGWGLYYVGGESLRQWISLGHSWLGLLLPLIIFVHIQQSR